MSYESCADKDCPACALARFYETLLEQDFPASSIVPMTLDVLMAIVGNHLDVEMAVDDTPFITRTVH